MPSEEACVCWLRASIAIKAITQAASIAAGFMLSPSDEITLMSNGLARFAAESITKRVSGVRCRVSGVGGNNPLFQISNFKFEISDVPPRYRAERKRIMRPEH